jgi:hypothetical protein
LCYVAVTHAVDYAKFYSRSQPVIILVFDESGTVIETHELAGDFIAAARRRRRNVTPAGWVRFFRRGPP